MTQKLSKSVLNVVESGTGAVMTPIVESRPGKAFLNMMPGEVLLASLDALSKFIPSFLYLIATTNSNEFKIVYCQCTDKIIDAAEAAEKQTMVATSGAVTTAVTNR